MFKIIHSKGFHITFGNGVTVSVQFGGGNYCENRHIKIGAEKETNVLQCPTAEIAIWDKEGDWILPKIYKSNSDMMDNVEGYVTPNRLLFILIWSASYKTNRIIHFLSGVIFRFLYKR